MTKAYPSGYTDRTSKATHEVDLYRRLLAAVGHELDEISSSLNDRGAKAKLSHARTILEWVEHSAGTDTTLVTQLEGTLRTMAVSNPTDSEFTSALYQLSQLKGYRLVERPDCESSSVPASEGEPTPELVTKYLRTRPNGAKDSAHAVHTIHGGFSKRTILVECTLEGVSADIVFRQVPLGRSARSLSPEYDVVRATYEAGLPVPEPLWIEPEDNILGGPFFVSRRVSGENLGDVWGPVGVTPEICREVAQIYARLHSIPVDDLQAPISPRTTPDELKAMLEWQENTLQKRSITPSPELEALISWLRTNLPPTAERRSLIHGDAAFSNLLIDNTRVSAILDWEASHLGDPAEELAYLKPSIEPVLPWQDFLDTYSAAGGIVPQSDSLRFFEVWQHVWRHIGCLWMSQNFDNSGRYAAAVAAYVHGPRFLAAALNAAFGPFDTATT